MPLNKRDAERTLSLLWEFAEAATEEVTDSEGISTTEDVEPFRRVISMLHSYLTDIQPKAQPSFRTGSGIDVPLTSQAKPQLVKFLLKSNQKFGVEVQRLVNSSDVTDLHPFFISHIDDGSVVHKSGQLKNGDIVLEINDRPLSDVTLERAR